MAKAVRSGTAGDASRSRVLRPGHVFWLLVAVLALGHGSCLLWGLPNQWDWALDSVDGQTVLGVYNERFLSGGIETYPPLHGRLVTLAWIPVRWLVFGGSLIGQAELELAMTTAILTGRVISFVMLVALLMAVRRLGQRLWNDWSGVAAATVVALSVPFAYYGHTSNREVPYLCWYAWALVFLLQAVRHGRLRDYLLMSLMISLSLATKDQAGGFLPLTGLYVLGALFLQHRREGHSGWRALVDKRLLLSVVVMVGCFVANWGLASVLGWILVLPEHLIAKADSVAAFRQHWDGLFGGSFEQYRQFENSFAGRLQLFWRLGALCREAMGWPMLVVAAGGTALAASEARRRGGVAALWIPTLSYILCFEMIVLVAWLRWAMPFVIVLGLMAGRLIAWLPTQWPRWRGIWVSLGVLLLAYQCWYAGSVWVVSVQDARYRADKWIASHIGTTGVDRPGATGVGTEVKPRSVMTCVGMVYLPRFFGQGYTVYYEEPRLENLKARRPDYLVLVFPSDSANADWADPRATAVPGAGVKFLKDLLQGRLVDDQLRYRRRPEEFRPPAMTWPAWGIPTLGRRIVIIERVTPPVGSPAALEEASPEMSPD